MKSLALFVSVLALLATAAGSRPAPSPSPSTTTATPPDPSGPFPGGGAWLEERAHAALASRRCSDPAVGLVIRRAANAGGSGGGSSAPSSDLVALGSLAALRSVARPPPSSDDGDDKKAMTIEEFASKPLTLVSVDTPRLCLTAPNVVPTSPELNREEGVDVAVTACNVPGAASGTATVFSVEDAPTRAPSAFAAAPSPSSSPLSSSSAVATTSASPALIFRSLPRRSIENAPVTPASGAHSGAAAGPLVDLRPSSAAAAKSARDDGDRGGNGADDEKTLPPSRCLVASGGRARLGRCPPPSSPNFVASTWRVAPANVTVTSLVVDGGQAQREQQQQSQQRAAAAAAAAPPRYTWKTTTGFLLVNQASGDCVSASGEIAACDPRADGMLFKLCSGPGKCAEFTKPEC